MSLCGVRIASPRFLPVRQIIAMIFHAKGADQVEKLEHAEGMIVQTEADEGATLLWVEFLKPLDDANHPLLLKKLELS